MEPASSLQRTEKIDWFIKCKITGNHFQLLLLSLTPQPETKQNKKQARIEGVFLAEPA